MNDGRDDGSFGQEGSEYPLLRPEQERSAYSDAYYRAAPREGRSDYGYNPARYYDLCEPQDAPRHRGPFGVRGILVLALVCVLVAGALGIGGLYLLGQERRPSLNSAPPDYFPLTQDAEGPILTVSQPTGDAPLPGEEIYALACPQVVCVSCTGAKGSGIVLSADGYIITNYHVIESAYLLGRTITVTTNDGKDYAAQVTGAESDSDLAVLKIDAEGLSPAQFCDSETVCIGQQVYAVGNPLGALDRTMTRGTLSAPDRQIAVGESAASMFQFDAAVNRGNAGGPVYNVYGQVIGVVTAKYTADSAEGMGFAIPSSDACAIANELITKGYVSGKAYLGITSDSVSPAVARYFHMTPGAFVKAVAPGSAAEIAGLQPGDVITAVDDTAVDGADGLVAALRRYKAGEIARLTISRDQRTLTLSVTFDEAPAPTQ